MAKDKEAPAAGSKGVSRSQAETLVTRYFACKDKIAKINADAKKKAEGARADMGVVIDDAERLGIERRAFKTTLKRIALARAADEARAKLQADERDALDHLEDMIEAGHQSWDDTPLGKAMALGKSTSEKPEPSKVRSDKVVDLAKAAGATPASH